MNYYFGRQESDASQGAAALTEARLGRRKGDSIGHPQGRLSSPARAHGNIQGQVLHLSRARSVTLNGEEPCCYLAMELPR